MTSTYRIVVADDDADVRAALSRVLASDSRFEVVAEVGDAHGLVDLVTENAAHGVLLDVRMPGGGAEAARALDGTAVVIAVSAETAPRTVHQLLAAGASGYVAKDRLGPCFPDLVARCLQGEVVLAVSTARRVIRKLVDAG